MTPTAETRLLYFADPMCSWCWGFAPVLARIADQYGDRVTIHLVLGGLRAGARAPLDPRQREEILHHWHAVHDKTGQPFRFEGALPEGFVYDTEIPSRAVVAVAELSPELTLPYFRAVQAAFYAEGRDVTDAETLRDLAAQQGLDGESFLDRFESDEVRAETREQFSLARNAGVTGFPTLLAHVGTRASVVTAGYRPFEELRLDV